MNPPNPLNPLNPPNPPWRNDARNAGPAPGGDKTRACPVCQQPFQPVGRQQVCSAACRQRAFRLRRGRPPSRPSVDEGALRAGLRRRAALVAHTIYECPECGEQYLGERRCPECNRFCRAAGLGGACPECEAVILLSDLLELAGEEAAEEAAEAPVISRSPLSRLSPLSPLSPERGSPPHPLSPETTTPTTPP